MSPSPTPTRTTTPQGAPQPDVANAWERDDWYRDAVLYQVYPRSFRDTNGDGVGDLRGIIDKLDYLAWLGIDAVWLSPINVSPNADFGYDVSDYYDVDPSLGTLADIDELIARARERNIRILLDLVPNHTSSANAWFVEAATTRDSRHRDWYVWADARADGSPPNNWMSHFGGSAWTWHEPTGQYYLHNFLPEQPDLNWWNDEVRAEFDRVISFWLDRGVAGFRIDVCHGIIKDKLLRDDPAADSSDPTHTWQPQRVYSLNRPEVHDVLQGWRALADTYRPGAVLIGETWANDLPALARFYGSGSDELHLAFNFHFTMAPMHAQTLIDIVLETEAAIPRDAWPVWTLSNHDISRFPTRWADGNEAAAKAGLVTLLTMRGTPVLYYGDELGMVDGDVPTSMIHDPVGRAELAGKEGRDPVRTPMQWDATKTGGFCANGAQPWLPLADPATRNVIDQRDDPTSMLSLCRALIALRAERAELRRGTWLPLPADEGVMAFQRGESTLVVVNMTANAARFDLAALPKGTILLDTDPARTGTDVGDVLTLAPWQATIIAL